MIGASPPRREDARLLTGRARFVADVVVPGAAALVFVRSAVAHGHLRVVHVDAASGAPGVIAVLTGADLAARSEPFDHRLAIPGVRPLRWPVLAVDRVRYVGDPVAVVVARDEARAIDAAALVELDIDELPAVVGVHRALDPDAPVLFDGWDDNAFARVSASFGRPDEELAWAPHRATVCFEHHRICGAPMEGHAVAATIDPATDRLTVWASNQQPHQLRTVIAEVCRRPESTVRVIAPDMGGGFGNKQHFTREEAAVALTACLLRRPVRWAATKGEQLTASIHSRPQHHEIEVGFADDGRLLALKARITADLGAPLLYFSGLGPSLVTAGSMPLAYALPHYAYELVGVATTTCPVGAYRGFGQPQAHATMERVMDTIAATLGLDRVAVRRRNLWPDGAPRPIIAAPGARLDIGPQQAQLDQLLDAFGLDHWRRVQADARAEGRLVGIGLSCVVEAAAPTQLGVAGRFGSFESAMVQMAPDGRVRVQVGTKCNGQGHETVFAQVAASVLGVAVTDVDVSDGDTDALPYGMGTWGSRSAVMGGGAVLRAAEGVAARLATIARHLVGAVADAPVVIADGWCAVGEAGVSVAEVARVAWHEPHRLPPGTAPGLAAHEVYAPGNSSAVPDADGRMNFNETYSTCATAVVVEIDRETAVVRLLDAVMAHDCGTVINPTVLDGQLQGGFTQGVAAVLHERIVYDEHGQPRTAGLQDYLVPTAVEAPTLRVVHGCTPSGLAGGFRGAAEGPIIAAPAVLVSAVNDALAPLGRAVGSTDCSPLALFELLTAAKGALSVE